MASPLNIDANRRALKWSTRELIGRALWELLSVPLFAWSPRPFWSWRRAILRIFGAKVGRHVHIFPSAKISIPWNLSIGDYSAIGDGAILYALGPVSIGERVTISQYAHLCAGSHDYSDQAMLLLKLPIVIEDDVWVCADAFVGPNVKIEKQSIVGARSVVVSDVAKGVIVGGNPARIIRKRPPIE
jgi:putative colanic acid biosynthesis acetyltransferase WcaF